MASLESVNRKLRRRIKARRRQYRKWKATRKRGHLKAFRRHRAAVRKLRAIRVRLVRAPKVVGAAEIGIFPAAIFGGLGTPYYVTGHYTAGPKDTSDSHAIELCQAYDRDHRAKGWGGIGYHYSICRSGTIIGLRPIAQKGAHVGGYNTGNVGIMVHGTIGDTPTEAQERSLGWLLENAHTAKLPAAHRAPVSLSRLPRRGHKEWPGHQSNSCPGSFLDFYHRGGTQ